MIPRVFVSSTYYDLKHVRERLEKFIENYGFEPILFESDKVTYQHGKAIDQSAYYEVGLCHIMVLIIGGRYGSPSTLANVDEERKKYDEEFISITRAEFETAIKKGIPALIFVDKNVHSDYETYKENQDFFDNLYSSTPIDQKTKKQFKFAHVDHVNIFKFIDLVRLNPIKTFEKVEEIELYIKAQLSGMFYLYLESLKRKSDENKILDTIAELNSVTLRMNEMLSSVGEKILGKDKKEYEKVIDSQFSIMIDFFIEQFNNNIDFSDTIPEVEISKIDFNEIAKIIFNETLNKQYPTLPKSRIERTAFVKETTKAVISKLNEILSTYNSNMIIEKFNFLYVNRVFLEKVKPFIKNNNDEEKLIEKLENKLLFKLTYGL